MMARFALICLGIFAASLGCVRAGYEEDEKRFKEYIHPILKECETELGITAEEMKAAKESKSIDALNPCLFGCVGKKIQMINDKGLFDVDLSIESAKQFIKDEKDQMKFAEIANSCASVNDQNVSDGEAGCERGKLLFLCIFKNKDLQVE